MSRSAKWHGTRWDTERNRGNFDIARMNAEKAAKKEEEQSERGDGTEELELKETDEISVSRKGFEALGFHLRKTEGNNETPE